MELALLQLHQRLLLLLGTATLAVPDLQTADLTQLCGQTWQGAGLLLRSHAASRRFYFVAPDTDCGLWLQAAAPGNRIRFQFRFFLVYSLTKAAPKPPPDASTPAPSHPCAPGSYLQLYEGPPGAPRPLGAPLCGLTIPASVTSSGRFLGLRLVTRGRHPRVDFVGEVTSFHLGPCDTYFRCQNGRCIPPSLVCDHWGMDNCGDGSDQGSWPPASCRGPSLPPSQAGSTVNDSSKPATLSVTLSSTGLLGGAVQKRHPEGQECAQRDAALEGPGLHALALASLLLLASAGLLVGLLWRLCSSGWAVWQLGARGLCLSCRAARKICYPCPSRVAPGGLWGHRPAFQDQGGHP
ncbi:low-density lipoprotein receptor class A domain-containing protein 2 [Octodon degus]|uniref:Low-density lipoprotein receptor class A domain-containing protein 2 n=1 Tax=Octodon degus TaxID=10160 RepID=A0A6P3FHQ3_OCTDE|nr:low-density lipoprotein receptor class A domain-containing protein 2 [Octodon degus]